MFNWQMTGTSRRKVKVSRSVKFKQLFLLELLARTSLPPESGVEAPDRLEPRQVVFAHVVSDSAGSFSFT